MTRVGWVIDPPTYVGGAELTAETFRKAAPDSVEIVDCAPGKIPDCDRYVAHNCVRYAPPDIRRILQRPTFKYWHDVGAWMNPEVRLLLDAEATPICCSPIQADYMGLDAKLIPPATDFGLFVRAADRVNGSRRGAVSVGSWRNLGKGARNVMRWAEEHEPVDCFGAGTFAPPNCRQVEYATIPSLLARYQTFVFLPTVIEPFGRCVAEAYAAGCEIVTNELVGALHWIRHDPDAMNTAASDFWATVMA